MSHTFLLLKVGGEEPAAAGGDALEIDEGAGFIITDDGDKILINSLIAGFFVSAWHAIQTSILGAVNGGDFFFPS